MGKLKVIILPMLLGGVSINTLAESEYQVETKILTISAVKIGSGRVYDAKLKLNDAGGFDIVGYLDVPLAASTGRVTDVCTKDNIVIEKVNQLSKGLTLDQVNRIIGCKGKSIELGSLGTHNSWSLLGMSVPRIAMGGSNDGVVHSFKYTTELK